MDVRSLSSYKLDGLEWTFTDIRFRERGRDPWPSCLPPADLVGTVCLVKPEWSPKKVAAKSFILQADAAPLSSAPVWAEPSQMLIGMWDFPPGRLGPHSEKTVSRELVPMVFG
jgi:hypothetical protein